MKRNFFFYGGNVFEITIHGVEMRLWNLIGEYIFGKDFKGKKFRHLALLIPSCKQNFRQ